MQKENFYRKELKEKKTDNHMATGIMYKLLWGKKTVLHLKTATEAAH